MMTKKTLDLKEFFKSYKNSSSLEEVVNETINEKEKKNDLNS